MSAQHPPTVLVVNDDPKMLELLVDLLTEEGYKTVSAAEGAKALQLIQVVKIDTVICDVVMPGMDGLEVSRKLKEDPQTANVPILLVSALQSQDEAALKGLESGAEGHLQAERLRRIRRRAGTHSQNLQWPRQDILPRGL